MLKQMLLHKALLASILFIIISIVISPTPEIVSVLSNIFNTALTRKKINQTAVVTIKFTIYMSH